MFKTMTEFIKWIIALFEAGWATETSGRHDFRGVTMREFKSVDRSVHPSKYFHGTTTPGLEGMRNHKWMILPGLAHHGENRCDPDGGLAIRGDVKAISLAVTATQALSYAGPVYIFQKNWKANLVSASHDYSGITDHGTKGQA